MGRSSKPGTNTKQELLDAGITIMLEKGYTNAGLQQVLDTVGVPKGSFYHYFESKEEFALEMIRYFDQSYQQQVLVCLRDPEFSPLVRLGNFCRANRQKIEGGHCASGCLIGNLSQEMASQSERLREQLDQVFVRWRDLFAACMAEGQAIGQINDQFDPLELADLFLSGWEGAVLRSKSTKSVAPLDNFINLMFVFIARGDSLKKSGQITRPDSNHNAA